ncbi:unnamed protein product [Moneuplotes crassus]|uniref:Uncharacterized protein n=1 Tax=Euplotes crassus TaxID=5936 RepID=A0AAD1XUX4_EUPCR|nr:unnamed protein product [Moneuplotes crassus]
MEGIKIITKGNGHQIYQNSEGKAFQVHHRFGNRNTYRCNRYKTGCKAKLTVYKDGKIVKSKQGHTCIDTPLKSKGSESMSMQKTKKVKKRVLKAKQKRKTGGNVISKSNKNSQRSNTKRVLRSTAQPKYSQSTNLGNDISDEVQKCSLKANLSCASSVIIDQSLIKDSSKPSLEKLSKIDLKNDLKDTEDISESMKNFLGETDYLHLYNKVKEDEGDENLYKDWLRVPSAEKLSCLPYDLLTKALNLKVLRYTERMKPSK